jgi:hypothetical protein
MQANIFPLKEFNDWEAITPKTYPVLKTFIGGAIYASLIGAATLQHGGSDGVHHAK